MPRLVPNPIGDLMHPLQQIESAVAPLVEKLRPVDTLPSVHAELVEVNKNLKAVHETLEALRGDLALSQAAGASSSRAKR